ncbi:MAG: LysM peptidoglycan-binding domain-containing protein [Kiritimatiellae bacterium]|nr:LysM peptidoglycan-binding domain-containing protein [Kiritimatiellia bacterium]
MAFSRGRYGVEYNSAGRRDGDRHLLRWALVIIGVLGVISVISVRGRISYEKLPPIVPPPQPQLPTPPELHPANPPLAPASVNKKPQIPPGAPRLARPATPPTERPAQPAPLTPAAKQVQRWLADSEGRPPQDRNLLERLFAAEREGNAQLARDTLERLRQKPSMADLDEPLARRLGALNIAWLFSDRPAPWTTTVTTRRGDSYHRIAREHGTTLAAVLALNKIADGTTKPEAGLKLRVPDFPRATLVVHRQTKQADITLNGKFFKRYYASTGAATKVGSYPVTREMGPRMRFKDLGITFAPADLDEIAMLLPPGASIAVTNP